MNTSSCKPFKGHAVSIVSSLSGLIPDPVVVRILGGSPVACVKVSAYIILRRLGDKMRTTSVF